MGRLQRRHYGVIVSRDDQSHLFYHTFGKYMCFQHLSHSTPLPFSTLIHLLSSMSLEHRIHVNTFSRCLASPLVVDSCDCLSFLDLSGGPPKAPEIVAPRRTTTPPCAGGSRCTCDVKERIGGFDARVCLVDEVGDSGVSVDVGDCRSAARALSRPVSVEARSVRG